MKTIIVPRKRSQCLRATQDFFLREARAVVAGPMAVVRLGTCGCLQESVYLGRCNQVMPLLVGGLEHFLFFHILIILGIILPIGYFFQNG